MNFKILLLIVNFAVLVFSFTITDVVSANSTWTNTGLTDAAGREDPTINLLQNGKVLITGGGASLYTAWAELYDPLSGQWSHTTIMLNARQHHASTLLDDGRVLITGGYGGIGSDIDILNTAEIYDPTNTVWQFTSTNMNSRRLGHTATLLNDGRALVVGGHNNSPISSVEVYNPNNDTWTQKAQLPQARQLHTATLLPDGRVFIVGGHLINGIPTNTTAFYDPLTDNWTAGPSLAYSRVSHTTTLLQDGRVLVAGEGTNTEIWSPNTNQWTTTSPMNSFRRNHSATLLTDGRVLVAGGYGGGVLNTAEIYDPATGQWSITASMNTERYGHGAVLLNDGTVLVVTGRSQPNYTRTSEIYTPSGETPPVKTPLILIPGIGGSEFKSNQTFTSDIRDCGIFPPFTYTANDIVWLDILKAASPCDDYFDVLKLNLDGETPQFPQIVLNGTFVSLAYGNFVDFFTANGYTLNQDLFLFPYDWRMDVTTTEGLLDQKIIEIIDQTGTDKVDIVAHSMGGLVARNYISDSARAQKVRKLFTLGTPHLGATEFIKNLMYGGCLSKDFLKKPICFGVSPSEVKDVVQNMIGGFELAPSEAYFNFYTGDDKLYPYPFRDVRDIDNDGVTGPLDYFQTKTMLTNLQHNTDLFTPTESFHELDQNLPKTKGVDVRVIAGSGVSTLGQIIEKQRITRGGGRAPMRDEITINGDGTVPLYSASLFDPDNSLPLLGDARLYYTKQKHGALVTDGPALDLVKNILNDNPATPSGVFFQPYKLKGFLLSVHSPVEIHVYENGDHTGPTVDGGFEVNIPGSSYDTIDDARFIWLPDDGVYTIEFEATGLGSFDFKIRKFENDLNTQTILYKDVPLTNTTTGSAVFDTQSLQPPPLNLDTNGDGIEDLQVGYFNILEGEENYDHTSPTISFDVNPKTIWPPNGKMINVFITGIINDQNPYITEISVEDEYGLVEPIIDPSYETAINQTIPLEAFRRGDDKDGRLYTIKILTTDLAGNTSEESFEILVPHDSRK